MTEVGKAMELEFTPYIGDLCPYLLEIVENTNAKEKTSIVLIKNTLNCISAIVPCLSGHIHVILTPVLTILDSTRTEIDVRCEAVKTLHLIAQNHDVSDRAAAIMQVNIFLIYHKLYLNIIFVCLDLATMYSSKRSARASNVTLKRRYESSKRLIIKQ